MANRLAAQGERRRERMMNFIEKFIREKGYSPTISEIGKAVGVSSPNATRNHLLKLQEEGKITMQERTPRSISVANGKKRKRG